MNKHIVFTQITRNLYNQLLKEKVIYPKFGISCNACNNMAEKHLINRLGFNFFFGWEDMNMVQQYKGKLKYSNNANSKFVLLKMEIDKNDIIRTNYYNYADLIFAFSLLKNNEALTSPNFISALENEFGKNTTIEQLTNFIFTDIEDDTLIQILFKKLDINNIISIKNLDDIEV